MSALAAEEAALANVFRAAEVDGFFHARVVGGDGELAHRDREPVVAASVFKLPVLVELFRQVDGRAEGPTGLSIFQDPVRLSWRDLATSMMVVSDNAATDVVCERVALDAVNATAAAFDLDATWVASDCRGIFALVYEDVGVDSFDDFPEELSRELLERQRCLDPQQTNRTTARDMTRLLELVWTDQAASPEACAEMRSILSKQVWPHRLASGFPEDAITTSGKTGTLLGWRNEVGVVERKGADQRVAVACFTRSYRPWKHPAADAAIGAAARVAVDALLPGN
jgi:beta-lactamase class A